ncbi:SDR family oxidoreductase [Paenibacillus sp. PAMC21692]|uniref:SDR family oxidoreductase n=1 Tax=Paenibacillus sp. PAMC21692 TaxID=2762320 RepID=UPI00164D11C3|nr:SDR family oxidoreductase [Paenibacillus sp. PAMC21692]QNK55725.1 SDR family oxidoreductase [Paenibacillus sp. PAMC21692]
MSRKLAMVTGANSGMGLATSIGLAKAGMRVVMVCRSEARGKEALAKVRDAAGGDAAELMLCDLGSFADIRRFAAEFNSRGDALDVLVNNAGVVSLKRTLTKDGFESMIGINHLGHFLFTMLLLDRIKEAKQGRIVVVASGAYKAGRLNFNDLNLTKGFNVAKGYGQSKLANILFARSLAKRLVGTTTTVNSLHPGAVATNIGVSRETGFGKSVHVLLKPFFLTPEQGSETALHLALSPEAKDASGEYFYKKQAQALTGKAADDESAERLWKWSMEAVGLKG